MAPFLRLILRQSSHQSGVIIHCLDASLERRGTHKRAKKVYY